VRLWLVVSCCSAAAFCVVRGFEFAALNVRWDSNAYGSVVWLLLGLHTTHIVTDLIDSIVLAVLFFTGPLDGKRYVDVSENSFYWYFVVAPGSRSTWSSTGAPGAEPCTTWLALVLAPSVALACAEHDVSLVTPSCSGAGAAGLHLVAAVALLATVVLAVLAFARVVAARGTRFAGRRRGRGPVETRRFLADGGHRGGGAVGAGDPGMWFAAWVLSPCDLWPCAAAAAAAGARPRARGRARRRRRVDVEPRALAAGAAAAVRGGYARGVRRLWRVAGRGRGMGRRRWRSRRLAGAGGSRWCRRSTPLGGRLFSAHMVQHELLMVVAAPLLVMGRPLATWTWAFDRRSAAASAAVPVGAAGRRAGPRSPTRWWRGPARLALWAWHIPALFDAALRTRAGTSLQHASFLGTALFFWWAVLGHDPRGRYGRRAFRGLPVHHHAAHGGAGRAAEPGAHALVRAYIPQTGALGIRPGGRPAARRAGDVGAGGTGLRWRVCLLTASGERANIQPFLYEPGLPM
jgi:hypothetical protein